MHLNPEHVIPYQQCQLQICVDEYGGGEPSGRIYSGLGGQEYHFASLMPLLRLTEELLDREGVRQRFEQNRSMSSTAAQPLLVFGRQREEHLPGRLASFSVRVNFRQHATWQGEVRWFEKKRAVAFRSALELLFIMDGVLAELTAPKAAES